MSRAFLIFVVVSLQLVLWLLKLFSVAHLHFFFACTVACVLVAAARSIHIYEIVPLCWAVRLVSVCHTPLISLGRADEECTLVLL